MSSDLPQGVQHSPIILAIDPGRDKCGVAVVGASGAVLLHEIYPSSAMPTAVAPLVAAYAITQIVLGDATTSQRLHEAITQSLPHVPITTIDETGSTFEARSLYWQSNPPRGWRRLVPLSLQSPPEPVDDFAAVILARRYQSLGDKMTR